jgi:broad specificity phosphatase PhoE
MDLYLLLVRHAQTASNVTRRYMGWLDEPLDDTGQGQAQTLGQRLCDWPIAAVYSSPLARAVQTARAVARPHGLTVRPDADLGEIRMEAWQGLTADEIEQRYPTEWFAWRTDPSGLEMRGLEPLRDLERRTRRALRGIRTRHAGQLAAVVTHDAVIRVILLEHLGLHRTAYRSFTVDNAALTLIRFNKPRNELVLFNDTAHLDGNRKRLGSLRLRPSPPSR